MPQRSNGACLGEKVFNFMTCHLLMEHFKGGLGVQMNMLPQIDVSKVALPEKLDETIVAQLLSHAVDHGRPSSWERTDSEPRNRCKTSPLDGRKATLKGTLILSSECRLMYYMLRWAELQL